ncbi:complement regulator-acquiring protein (plasmid) [Borrelia coriaceae]|uniref:Antigen P35 n=1 Tax=Borrelia coriaceae ATCC 43381 TaxID=1408429 RepID=W5T1M0_9SPIR|nr:complement regulator-acquiring protein [Borrelia coriaceae]AHH11161.1 Antigen P35 [Borrelia coriaceae ATCC 43381]UPA16967.1 complement regulator-acquiring protein [Borrelia coriaceae]
MRSNILNNIFITFTLTALTLTGCDLKDMGKLQAFLTNPQIDQGDNTKILTLSTQLPNTNAELVTEVKDEQPAKDEATKATEIKDEKLEAKEHKKPEATQDEQKEQEKEDKTPATTENEQTTQEKEIILPIQDEIPAKTHQDQEQKQLQDNPTEEEIVKPTEDREKTTLIEEIIQKTQEGINSINEYSKNTENDDQYGMKEGVFNILVNTKNEKKLQSNENTKARQIFYLSLNWKEDTLKKFGTILNKIAQSDTNNHLAKTLVSIGANYPQLHFARTINTIYNKKDSLENLELQELKNIKSNLEEIYELRYKWIDTIDKIIAAYDTNNIQNNTQNLITHINFNYETILINEIPKIEVLAKDIAKILN